MRVMTTGGAIVRIVKFEQTVENVCTVRNLQTFNPMFSFLVKNIVTGQYKLLPVSEMDLSVEAMIEAYPTVH